MQKLSSSLDAMREHYDAVVVGSGYGAGVAASRLSRAGRTVCVLERGSERHPGEYPDTLREASRQIQIDSASGHVGSPVGMFDFRVNCDLNVLVGCGLGGTSLINANVSLPPDSRVLDDALWPVSFREDRDTLLRDAFAHATAMLRPASYPENWPALNKLVAHQRSAEALHEPFARVPINVTFEDGINHVGIEQRRCTLCGDCVTGCNESAKNTTLMNYLPDAWNHGAQFFTETAVRYVEGRGNGWAVYFTTLATGREHFDDTLLSVTADIVVLGAGTLGSTEILLRSRQRGLALPSRLGERFSGNGDVLGFAYNTRDRIDGVNTGPRSSSDKLAVGPCITSVIDMRGSGDVDEGLVIEEGSLPGALTPYLGAPMMVAGIAADQPREPRIVERIGRLQSEFESVVAPGGGAIAHTQTYLVMTHDGSDGRLRLEDDRLRVDWPGVGERQVFSRVHRHLEAATHALGGIFVKNPLWSSTLGHSLMTVHPLGGCVMADDATSGVVNHKGQVFAGVEGTEVHRGLYVMDGSVVPRSLGANPLLTITAIAERSCALLARDYGWTIDYRLPSSRSDRKKQTISVEFTERMTGFFAAVEESARLHPTAGFEQRQSVTGRRKSSPLEFEYEQAAAEGERTNSRFEFTLTVAVPNPERMIKDSEHAGTLFGTVRAPVLSPEPLSVRDGRFNLLVEDKGEIHTHRMRYCMRLHAVDGRVWYFDGFKVIRDASLMQVWPSTTTLYINVYNGSDDNAPLFGRGILRIKADDFARQLSTLKVHGTSDARREARALGAFGRVFAGRLWEHYGGALACDPVPGDRAVVRKKRALAAPAPEVHFFRTPTGVELRLIRYEGGHKGPLICAPGFSNTSQVFAWDGIATNWVEFFTGNGYDVWLFDYRASPDLPASRTQFTLDAVALDDWPTAVEYVLAATRADSVQALGHCLGSATGFMGLLAGRLPRIRQFVGSQVMPFIEVSPASKLKAGMRVDSVLSAFGSREVSTRAGRGAGGKMIDELLRLDPMPREWRGLGAVCRRIYAIYGPVMKPENLNRDTRDALAWIFGYGNLTAFGQIRQLITHRRLVDAQGRDVYLPNASRLSAQVVLMQGSDNALFLPSGTQQTLEWMHANHGSESCRALSIPGYAHLDCFIGRDAARDVFPAVLRELDTGN